MYHHKTTQGQPMVFHNRPWMDKIYMDDSQQIVIRKSSQIGISEWAIIDLFMETGNGRSCMYILPRDKDAHSFTPRRLNRPIRKVDLYKAHAKVDRKATDTKTEKLLFDTDVFIIGSQAETNFYEKPVSTIYFDEKDKCNQQNLQLAFDRLGAAEFPKTRTLGNPTLEGSGIDKDFTDSDAKHWLLKCPACNHWQTMGGTAWFDNIITFDDNGKAILRCFSNDEAAEGRPIFPVCTQCAAPLDRLAQGDWVAEHPGAHVSGYHCSRLFGDPRQVTLVPGGVLNELWLMYQRAIANPSLMQTFWNNQLGIPFTGTGNRIDEALMKICVMEDYTMPINTRVMGQDAPLVTWAGMDIGAVHHLHIECWKDGRRQKLFMGQVPGLAEASRIGELYGVSCWVLDAQGEIHPQREFQEAHPNTWLCYYNKSEKVKEPISLDTKMLTCAVNRTESLDASYQAYALGQVILPGNFQAVDDGDLVKQMKAPVRVIDPNSPPLMPRYIWDEGGKADHHRHADNYALIASTISGGSGEISWLS